MMISIVNYGWEGYVNLHKAPAMEERRGRLKGEKCNIKSIDLGFER